MMANLNLNVSPYFDDFDPDKDFLRVLFRPGFPVQARELTTLQSFMTNQVRRFGNHIFKNGARVSEGTINVVNGSNYMFLTGSGNASLPISNARAGTAIADLNTLEGKIITNSDGTVRARVLKQPTGSVGTANVGALYFQYITAKVFSSTGDYIYATLADNPGLTVGLVNTFNALSPACLGEVAEGVYYVNGFFTRVPAQTVIISTTSQTPSAKLGFRAEQAVTTQNNDATLYDNARGTTNEGAPGSHRLQQTLSFVALPIDSTEDETFFRALTIENGVIVNQTKGNAQYNNLGDVLARRTFDESGNYAVKPFTVIVSDGDSDNYKLKIGPAKAYVKGYEITKRNPQILTYTKNSDFKRTSNFKVPFNNISNFLVLSSSGTLPGQTGSDPYTYANRLLLKDSDGDTIGVARAYGFYNDSLYVYDTKMFQVITTSSSLTVSDGNDINASKAVGYVYNADGQAGATGNATTLINWSARLPRAQEVSSTVATIGSGITINKSQVYELDDVVTITGAGGFTASVQELSLLNPNPSLVTTLTNEVKTLRGTSTVFDNDFTIVEDTGLSSSTINGYWNASRVDDQEEIEKVLKFKYLKIKNTGDGVARTGVNFGWSAQDKHISLAYPDILQVYGINQSTNATFTAGQFTRIEINTTGLVPVGSTVKGLSSGTEAIVALQNATSTGAGDIAATSGYHSFLTGTGSNTTLEVIYQKNTAFTTGETLKVTSPAGITAYTSPINYVSATAATGKNISALYNLDNGQRNEFYDIGRLVRVGNRKAPPSGDIIVFYSYFSASPVNNFFYSTDSYRNLNYYKDDVRLYSEPQPIGTNIRNEGRDLRNSIDFRFRVEDIVTDITSSPFIFSSRNYYNQPRIQPDTVFTTDMDEYLGHILLLSLDEKGTYVSKKGQPSVKNFKRPEVTPDVMPVAFITVPGGVRYPETEIETVIVDNKRYTMRDIGKIEDRINRLEESVALSLLESQALHDNINERAKSGFVVDDFSLAENNPNSSADPAHPEYNATIDVVDNILIPGQTDGVPITMEVSAKDNINEHYFTERGIVVKDFKEEQLVAMTQATGCHRINPFATWIYIGDMTLTPSEHHWRDKVNSYFTEFNGRVRPFSGDSDRFSQFLRVTTASPGGSSTSRREWFGAQSSTSSQSGRTITTTTRQARRRITTTTFGAPRVIAGTKPTETHTGSEVIENLQDYWMRNPAGGIKFEAANLKANTEHELTMGEVVIDGSVTTDVNGFVTGTFNVPYQTFKAGEEIVSLKDTFVDGNASSASAVFKSVGHRDFFDILAQTDNKRVDTLNLGVQVRSTSTRTLPPPRPPEPQGGGRGDDGGGSPGDPIAQLFRLPTKGTPTAAQVLAGEVGATIPNAIITSIDLWLCYVDERPQMNTMIAEIRETVNGYPAGPNKIIGSTGWVVLDKSMEVTTPTKTNGTNFKFRQPVSLKGETEYSIVLKSPSDATEVFVAEIGEQLLDGSGVHDEQPNVGGYFGSFFVSQNQTTWSAEQNTDMTFRLNRANFDINDTGLPPTSSLTMKNELSNLKTFKADIGAFNRGLAIETFEYSNYVRVIHPNHGMNYNNAQVKLMGFEAFGTPNNYNGIPDSELNGDHDVLYATIDTYFIKTTTKATSSGTPPVPIFDTFATQPVVFDSLVQQIPFFKTEEDDEVKVFINSATTNSLNLVVDSNKIKNDSIANVTPGVEVEIPVNEYVELEEPHIVRNLLNSNANDLVTRITLDSFNEYSSPMFNNNDSLYPVVFRNLTGTLLNDSDIEGLTTRIITSGSTDNTLQEYTSYLSAVQSELEFSAYCTKQIDLEIPADGFTIKFDADMEPGSKLEFSYKARAKGDQTPFEDISWEDFKAREFITEANNGPFTSDTDIKEYTVNANVPFEFTAFKIRVRMITNNEAQIPRIKDLRIIADI